MKKREGFTLIELIAVLVILSILLLIVTPIVINIIKKAHVTSNKRSVDYYGNNPYEAINDEGTVRPVVNINKVYLDKK